MENKYVIASLFLLMSTLLIPPFTQAQSDEIENPTDVNNPFHKLWLMIVSLREEVSEMWDSIKSLEEQVDGIDTVPERRIAMFNVTEQMHTGDIVSCNSDEFATGGGTSFFGDTGHSGVLQFYPVNDESWHIKVSGNIQPNSDNFIKLVCVRYQ